MDGIITAAVAVVTIIFGLKWGDEVERARLLLIYILVALLMLCVFAAAGSTADALLTYGGLPKLKDLLPLSPWELVLGVAGFYFSATLVACAVARYHFRVRGESVEARRASLEGWVFYGFYGPLFIFLAWLSFTVHNHVCPSGC